MFGLYQVVLRSIDVIVSCTIECGGEFFTRRFLKDAVPVFIRLLREGSMFSQKKKLKSPALLMPQYNKGVQETAPAARLKVQEAILEGISKIAVDKKSGSALLGSLSLVAAWVVLIACHVEALQEVATKAALALSNLDADLVWILVMDMVYGSVDQDFSVRTPKGFINFHEIFPPRQTPQDTLCIQYSSYEGELSNFSKDQAQRLLTRLETNDFPEA
jgi:hypothetical protein